jgi:hypothetical protein
VAACVESAKSIRLPEPSSDTKGAGLLAEVEVLYIINMVLPLETVQMLVVVIMNILLGNNEEQNVTWSFATNIFRVA